MTVAEAVTLIGAVTASVVAIISALMQWRSASVLSTVHQAVNSQSERMEILAKQAGAASSNVDPVGVTAADSPVA